MVHRKDLDVTAKPAHRQPDLPDAGTEHLAFFDPIFGRGEAPNSTSVIPKLSQTL